jgi:hypothetical protein
MTWLAWVICAHIQRQDAAPYVWVNFLDKRQCISQANKAAFKWRGGNVPLGL